MLHVIALAFAVSFGSAATFDVTDSADPGSLRTSVDSANSAGGANTVAWTNSTGGTITLGSSLTINGGNILDVGSANSAVTITSSTITLGGPVILANSNVSQPWTISSTLDGPGGLTTTGNGTFVLTGENSYSGGTTVNGGVLNISSDAALGDPTGVLVLNVGTLQTGASITSARTILLVTSGTIDTNGFDSTWSGFIGGTGQLVKLGAGTLYLTHANDYLGGTYVGGGVLNINSSSALGPGKLFLNGGTLQTSASITDGRAIEVMTSGGTLDNGGNTASFSGVVSGDGALVVTGTGTVAFSGTNTYLGGTTITGGATFAAMTGDANLGDASGQVILDSGTLQTRTGLTDSRLLFFVNAGGGTIDNFGKTDLFSGPILGTGALLFTGTGTVTLSGPNNWTGGTTVAAGTVKYGANDALPQNRDLAIASGGTVDLSGFSETLPMGNVTNDGMLNLRTGSMNILSGTYTGSGTLGVTLVSGFTNLTANNVNLSSSSVLSVSLANPFCAPGSTFTPVAWTTETGSFTIVSPALLTFTPTYGANGLTLMLGLVPLTSVAGTPNQKAVGAGLEAVRSGGSSDMGTVLSSLYSLNTSQVRAAMDQISPISLAAAGSMGVAATSVQTAALDRRMSALATGTDSGLDAYSIQQRSPAQTLLAEDGTSDTGARLMEPSGAPGERSSMFFSLVGSQVILNNATGSAGTQPGYIFSGGGFMTGIDHGLTPHLAGGLTVGYLYGKAQINAPASGVMSTNSARYGAYATAFAEDARLYMYIGGAQDYFNSNRGIDFGSIARSATSSPDGSEFNWNIRGEDDFSAGFLGTLTPFAALNSDHMTIHPFTETGAGALNLAVSGQTADSLRSMLGVRESFHYADEHYNCTGYLSGAWQHEFMDQSRPIDAQLASGGGAPFTVSTTDLPRDGAVIGAGASVKMGAGSVANVDYSYGFLSGYSENRLSATVRFRY
jgi:autotransporter-associated beta strand protein